MEMIDSAKSRNVPDEDINKTLHIYYRETDLTTAISIASNYKCIFDTNISVVKNNVEDYCVGDNAQYLAVMEGFLKSTTTSAMQKDIAFLNFALNLMNNRLTVAHDGITAYNAKANDVLNRLKPPP
jgi:hypothetical protein